MAQTKLSSLIDATLPEVFSGLTAEGTAILDRLRNDDRTLVIRTLTRIAELQAQNLVMPSTEEADAESVKSLINTLDFLRASYEIDAGRLAKGFLTALFTQLLPNLIESGVGLIDEALD